MVVDLLALSGQEAVAELAPLLHRELRVLVRARGRPRAQQSDP